MSNFVLLKHKLEQTMESRNTNWDTEYNVLTTSELRQKSHFEIKKAGQYIPFFQLCTNMCFFEPAMIHRFQKITWEAYAKKQPVVLSFLSGGWNQYGLEHLQKLQILQQEVAALGGKLLVFTDASREEIIDLRERFTILFDMVSDPTNQFAEQIGNYKQNYSPSDYISGVEGHVAIPTTLVINHFGKIIYDFSSVHFEKHVPISPILAALWAAKTNIPYRFSRPKAA